MEDDGESIGAENDSDTLVMGQVLPLTGGVGRCDGEDSQTA